MKAQGKAKKIELCESDYCAIFDEIPEDDGFVQAMRITHKAALSHTGYQHYMRLDDFAKMLKSRTFWLSRLDSPALNDWNEFGKYGSSYGWKRTYIGCFSYGRSESAAMWKMYCQPDENAVRVLISPSGLKAWDKQLRKVKTLCAYPIRENGKKPCPGCRRVQVKAAGFTDVLYVSMNGNDERHDDSGFMRWNGHGARISDLRQWVSCKGVEGFVKDLAWQYEQETRLFVVLKNEQCKARRLAVPIPDEVFKSMSFALSPWLPDKEVDFVKKGIEDLFESEGLPRPRTIRPSQLTGALNAKAWKR